MPVCIPLATGLLGVLVWAPLFEATDSQKGKKFVPDAPGRETRFFLGFSEPSGGSDPARAIQTKAFERATIGLSMAASCGLVALTGPTSDLGFARTDSDKGRKVSPAS
ncbi:MAG: hypothetical protein Ct9H90mP27_7550 [Gammaproteobacteria bacterium]|nr:MAG: hypothetical protein Ct9H90mP27_7550 [Gammaproteobacteria bacterium]